MELKEKIKLLPKKPGCYLWKNLNNEVIYIGKAKNIYNRVKQYFISNGNFKKQALMNEAVDVDFFIVNNENESLILESNLIKQYLPKYNILLKDQSQYPYIVITNEEHPKLLYTRKINKIKGTYFGPLADTNFKKFEIYKLLNDIVPFRKCNKLPKKKCIYYDIGKCLGPCIKKIDPNEYKKWKKVVSDFFSNKNDDILKIVKNKELQLAKMLNFEQAQSYKEIYNAIKRIEIMQIMEITNSKNIDFVSYMVINNYVYIIIFIFINKKLLSKEITKIMFIDNPEDEISTYLKNYYDNNIKPIEIVINIDNETLKMLNNYSNHFRLPKNKEEKNILMLACKNITSNYLLNSSKNNVDKQNINNCLKELEVLLGINNLKKIDVFDNSNIYLEHNITAVISYVNGIIDHKKTKYFKTKSIEKSDFHFMNESIFNYYKNSNKKTDLLIVDGGEIQITAAKQAINKLNLFIPIIGLQKNNKHKTESIIFNNQEIKLDKKSELYKFLSNMQDSVHNYAVKLFRNNKLKNDMHSILDDIPGIGKKTKEKLLEIFINIDGIKNASIYELEQVISKKQAKTVFYFFKS